MKAPMLGEAAIDLPWLGPCAATLSALARGPSARAWERVRLDPGGVLLLVRHPAVISSGDFSGQIPEVLDTALRQMDQPGHISWQHPALLPLYKSCFLQAFLAQTLAHHVAGCDPEQAWIGGLLAPLGWLAVAAVSPSAIGDCLHHRRFGAQPQEVQQQCWGLEHTAIARRLARRWNLPAWLATIVGHLGLPVGIAQALGAEPPLFQVVQLAVGLSQQHGSGLALAVGGEPEELRQALGLIPETICAALEKTQGQETPDLTLWKSPTEVPLLVDLLHVTIDSWGRSDRLLVERLQQDVDQLQKALEGQCASEKSRLKTQKLLALAELCAGAGHEINNPLAVISGQAQYLLLRENEPERRKALQTIVGQSQRIHHILRDLMQFARPAAPLKQVIDLGKLVAGVVDSLRDFAQDRQVHLGWAELPADIMVQADNAQLRHILLALLRNAIEAVPPDGWAGMRVQTGQSSEVEIVVEDSGEGPAPAIQEHMFDPFYSGRTAGRGRGLGLATAWRLTQNNGGVLSFAGHVNGVTRFILHLPMTNPGLPTPATNGHHQETNGSATLQAALP